MNIESLFYLFAAVAVFAALRVITARNPLHAVLYLVLTFVSSAGIWILLEAEFLAITLVLVYVGAVMVLFLFVVMMLDINIEQIRKGLRSEAFSVLSGDFDMLTTVLTGAFIAISFSAPPGPVAMETIRRGVRGGFSPALPQLIHAYLRGLSGGAKSCGA